MKFRIEAKDLYLFVVFCIFLLYLSAIAVLNFSCFTKNGYFFGFNPFPAFGREYFAATIVVFAGALILIFTSVSSYIFDKEKGKGIGLKIGEKDPEKGYSRWAKDKEVKTAKDIKKVIIKEENSQAGGVALINDGIEMYVDDGENHTLVIGATASGKTTCVVDPLIESLGKHGESMIVTDPKGELFKGHSEFLKAKGYDVIVLNFRDPANGNSWNPLTLPYQLYKEGLTDKATELLEDVAKNILIDPKNPGEPFWENNASDYFSGIALGLFEDAATENQVNLNSISYMASVGAERFGASDYIKEYFTLKGEQSSPYIFANSVINAPNETKGGVVSVFRQKIRIFASRENLSEMLSYTDFDLRAIGHKKTAIFMIIHDEKTTYHALATIFIKQCYETLISAAQKEENGKLPHRTNFILDEFANMPPLKDVTSMVTAARSRAIRFTFIIQNFAQLNQVYGNDDAQTIRSNCGNLIYLITTELAALEEISKLCGEIKSKDKDKTASTPLVTVADLQKLKENEVIILKARLNPFKTKLTPSFKINWGHNYPKGILPIRTPKDITLFDIKEHVKRLKKEQLFNNIDGPRTEPNELSMGPNPFLGSPNPMYDEHPRRISPNKNQGIDVDAFMKKIEAKMAEEEKNRNIPTRDINRQPSALDVDALISKIDAKIAEIEKEEAASKAQKPIIDETSKPEIELPKLKRVEVEIPVPNQLSTTKTTEYKDLVNEPKEEQKEPHFEEVLPTPSVKVDKDSIIVENNSISDDEFFDDFFGDE